MQFDMVYTLEQEKAREEFRKEVKEFVKANAPPVSDLPLDDRYVTREQLKRNKEFRIELGKKGWHNPTMPKAIGGGGLSLELASVIHEEVDRLTPWSSNGFLGGVGATSAGNDHSSGMISILEKIGTGEQKARLLPPLGRGEWVTWEVFTEPEAGSDLPSLQTPRRPRWRRVRDQRPQDVDRRNNAPPDMLMTLAITDTDAPRHRNLSVFLIPCNLPGIRILPIDALAPPYKNQLIFEDVRFPADRLVGEGGDGWVAFATGGGEGGGDRGPGRRRPMDEMVDYAKETERNGRRLSQDPDVHEVLTKAYVDNEIHRLLSLRNRWMGEQARAGTGKTRSTYEGGQMTVYNKELAPETSKPCSKLGALWC